jgi:hypothetical protein
MQWMRWSGVIMAAGLWACASEDDAGETVDAGAGGSTGGSIGGEPAGGAGGEPVGGEPLGGAGGEPVGGAPVGGEPLGGAGGEPQGGAGGEPQGGAGGEPVGGEPAGGAGGEPVGGAGGAGGEEPPPAPTTEEVQAILDANCNGCHIGGGMSGGMGLDDVTLQIGVPAASAPGINRIEAGDHLSSYLWHKINGTQAEVGGGGGQMPLGVPLLQEEIDLIAAWIDGL